MPLRDGWGYWELKRLRAWWRQERWDEAKRKSGCTVLAMLTIQVGAIAVAVVVWIVRAMLEV